MMRFLRFCCAAWILATLSGGCDWNPLEVENPTAIGDTDLDNPEGAELLRVQALDRMNEAFAGVPGAPFAGGLPRYVALLSDEFFADSDQRYYQAVSTVDELQRFDRREDDIEPLAVSSMLHSARHAAALTIRRLRNAAGPEAYLGQMFAVRGLTKLYLSDTVCPGQAFNEFSNERIRFTEPLTTTEAYQSVLEDLDSSVVYAADSARILLFAQVARARALLELGQFGEAAAAAAPVPTSYVLNAEFGEVSSNELFNITAEVLNALSVADRKGGNGLDFVSAGDPRVPTEFRMKAFDGVTDLYELRKYPTDQTPIPLASGIEARLIEAEAALEAGDGSWLKILNDLRATQITPPLDPLPDPSEPNARLDLLFRERAFWLFATGRRLGDLRRLVRLYGRTVEETFPWGQYRMGGIYGSATSFAIAESERLNPAVTGCTDR